MKISIDLRSDIPIYLQIVEQIRQQLTSGGLKPGDQLPTVRALASELRINFNTVGRAYRVLDESRLISTQRGRGTESRAGSKRRRCSKLRWGNGVAPTRRQ